MTKRCILFILSAALTTIISAASVSAQARSAAVRFAPAQIRETNARLRYSIKVRYPQALRAANNSRLVKLNQELRQFAERRVRDFKKDFSAPEVHVPGAASTFDIRYQVEHAADDLISIGFIVNSYYEGAVHGMYEIVAFNYDLSSGRLLNLKELFKPGSNYLGLISDYAINVLKKERPEAEDLQWIQTGAAPEEKNYQAWNLKREGLEITFNPYQVASYAEGPQVVIIPYRYLKDVMDPKGPLARISGTR